MEDSRNKKKAVYNSPDGISIEVAIDNSSVWLSQSQIAELFRVGRTIVTKRTQEICSSDGINKDAVCAKIEQTASDGKTYLTSVYNLDTILSIGYRYNFRVAQHFRQFYEETIEKYHKPTNPINEYFWFKRISSATQRYCTQFLRLSDSYVSDADIKDYMELIIRLRKGDDNEDRINPIIESKSVFPEDIRGYICHHGREKIFQPNHLMCKLVTLRDEANRVNYEFLIEYDIFDPATEIYYGVKAISDDIVSTDIFIETVESKWSEVREHTKLNKQRKADSNKDFYVRNRYRFKETDNSNNGTFWPFWIRYNEAIESLPDIVDSLKRIFKDYKKIHKFKLLDDDTKKFDNIIEIIKENEILIDNPFEKIDKEIEKRLGKESVQEFKDIILPNLENKNIIVRRKNGYELRGQINILSAYMRAAFEVMFSRRKSSADLSSEPPIERLREIILRENGKTIKTKSWENPLDIEHYKQIEKEVKKWFCSR